MDKLLQFEDFSDKVGDTFVVDTADGASDLILTEARMLPSSPRDPGFALDFAGPEAPILPQATYTLRGSGDSYDIFIVPVGPKDGAMRYEAVFN